MQRVTAPRHTSRRRAFWIALGGGVLAALVTCLVENDEASPPGIRVVVVGAPAGTHVVATPEDTQAYGRMDEVRAGAALMPLRGKGQRYDLQPMLPEGWTSWPRGQTAKPGDTVVFVALRQAEW